MKSFLQIGLVISLMVFLVGCATKFVVKGPIGESMSEDDVAKTQQALEQVEFEQPQEWTNPHTKNQYTITTNRIFKNDNGKKCHEYAIFATINEKQQQMISKACRQAYNSWKPID